MSTVRSYIFQYHRIDKQGAVSIQTWIVLIDSHGSKIVNFAKLDSYASKWVGKILADIVYSNLNTFNKVSKR